MLALLVLLLAGIAFSTPFNKRQAAPDSVPPNCVDITIPVTAYANNSALPAGLNTANFVELLNPDIFAAFGLLEGGSFDIAATYCPPAVQVEGRENTLQILVHGATYTKAYWFGLYYAQEYSWVNYAAYQGYPTLSIDRLGNGDSSHPNAITQVQFPLETQITHLIIEAARSGNLPLPAPFTGTQFSKIILVGHSVGSVLVNQINWLYPEDADATILTGYAPFIAFQLLGVFVESFLLPAPNLPLGYMQIDSQTDADFLFYTGPADSYDPELYDPNVAAYDFYYRGTVTLGEAATAVTGSQKASEYNRPLMVMTGQHDAAFCSLLTLDIPIVGSLLGTNTVTCGENEGDAVPSTQGLYPSTEIAFWYPDAGHCWHLQYAAMDGFATAHSWLADWNF